MELSIILAIAVAVAVGVAVAVLLIRRAEAKRRARGVFKNRTIVARKPEASIAPCQAPVVPPPVWATRQLPVAPPPQLPAAPPSQPPSEVVQRRKEPQFELVPHWMGNINARAVLPDDVWHGISRQVRASHGWRCCECLSSTDTECHEVWKYEWVWRPGRPRKVGVMRLTRLQTLCQLCHRGKHFKSAESRGELAPVKAHLMTLYALTERDWDRLVRKALDSKELKYKYAELDLTYLNDDRFAWVHERIGRKFSENEMPYIEQKKPSPSTETEE